MSSRYEEPEPTPEQLAEYERRKAEVQARWTPEERERKSTYDAPRPVRIPIVSITEMAAGARNGKRRSRKDAS